MSKKIDNKLGMQRQISRRDILHGFGALATASMLPAAGLASSLSSDSAIQSGNKRYPPSLMGMRGNHAGSFEVIHQLARYGQTDWGKVSYHDPQQYDLVVVGAGISGLSAAYFYLKERPNARILLLDNHDDFGGHAKRNEFDVDGRKLIGYGGAQTMQEPSGYPKIVKRMLKDLGVNFKSFNKAYDKHFYRRHKLSGGIYFNRQKWGSDTIINYDIANYADWLPVASSPLLASDAIRRMPISDGAKQQLIKLLSIKEDQIPHIPLKEKWDYLYTITYRDFLAHHMGVTEKEVFDIFQDLTTDSGVGIDAVDAVSAMWGYGLPGWDAAGLPEVEPDEPYIHHYPDGNAAVARQLVRRLIPQVAQGTTMEDLVTAQFDYSKLDSPDSPVRIRLDSAAIEVRHIGNKKFADKVAVSYMRQGKLQRVTAKAVIMACNNAAIPAICPELPSSQREALAFQVKVPILYTNVALRNWQAWKNLGIGAVACPGSYHINASLDFPVSYGEYSFASGPDDPIIVHMERFPHRSNQGLTPKEQYRLGRHELATTSFETIERNVRAQLAGMLGAGGFDPAQDIAGITVNRWAHGYAYWYRSLYDQEYEDYSDARYPHIIGRQQYGRIAIANSDSAATAMMEAAIEQGYRAVTELL